MNVILCGMMGAGKTVVGQRLAQRLGRRWIDTDACIVEKYGEIAAIFKRFGEEYFRGLETEIVAELVQKDGLVISVGGGLALREENVSLLKKNGKIVYLQASAEILTERLGTGNSRPLLQTGELLTTVEELLKKRASIYARAADFTVDTDGKTIENVAFEIEAFLERNK